MTFLSEEALRLQREQTAQQNDTPTSSDKGENA